MHKYNVNPEDIKREIREEALRSSHDVWPRVCIKHHNPSASINGVVDLSTVLRIERGGAWYRLLISEKASYCSPDAETVTMASTFERLIRAVEAARHCYQLNDLLALDPCQLSEEFRITQLVKERMI